MKRILVWGAGHSSGALIDYLGDRCQDSGWSVTVGDLSKSHVEEKTKGHPGLEAIELSLDDVERADPLIRDADLVISLLPQALHPRVAERCLAQGTNLLTASYVSDEMAALSDAAKAKGLLFLNECGLDPGIDHLSGMRVLDRIREQGGELTSFETFTGGLLAPNPDPNPWDYKFTWNPRNVVLAAQGGVKFLQEGLYKYIPYHRVYRRTEVIHIPGYGYFEGYGNRDSLKYLDVYGLEGIRTLYRGTLRRIGFCKAWDIFVQLGATDDSYEMEGVESMTHRGFINSFLSYSPTNSVDLKLAHYLNLDMESPEMFRMRWLGLFEDIPVGLERGTPAQVLEHILKKRWTLGPGDLDMIVMWHKFDFIEDGQPRQIRSHMVCVGEDSRRTAMAKTVGVPLGIAARLMLEGKLSRTGVCRPVTPDIYNPLLDELVNHGIDFSEREVSVGEDRWWEAPPPKARPRSRTSGGSGREPDAPRNKIGVRRENKSKWERRVPLIPSAVEALKKGSGVDIVVQTSPVRAFVDAEYQRVGAPVSVELDDCPVLMGVKEIPIDKLRAHKTYVCFSHVIKGQPENMPTLARMMELGCTLIDYEKITDADGRRLVFFGRYAGLAGMVDTLWALGQRMEHEGVQSPFQAVKPAHAYDNLDEIRVALKAVAKEIAAGGLPEQLQPLVCGFAGNGQVSKGAQEIYDLLGAEKVKPSELGALKGASDRCFAVVFEESDLVERLDGSAFDLQEYYQKPEEYQSKFFEQVQHLSLLVNGIYWEPKYPKLATKKQLAGLYSGDQPRLRVIGDITCDIEGSIESTTRPTGPGNPIYVYDPVTGETQDGAAGTGPVVLAVDFLPAELPKDASKNFSDALTRFVPDLARARLDGEFDDSGLPDELLRATVVYRGKLTERYKYLEAHLA